MDLKPFPHLVINNWLSESTAKNLLNALKKQCFTEKNTDLYQFLQTNDLACTEGVIGKLYSLLNSKQILEWVQLITGSKVRKASLAGFCYRKGDYLLPHDDRLENRKIAFILNLSKNFSVSDGGCLEFFYCKDGTPVRVVKKLVPVYNTLTLFKVSKTSFHQVGEILANKKRYSLGGWFYG